MRTVGDADSAYYPAVGALGAVKESLQCIPNRDRHRSRIVRNDMGTYRLSAGHPYPHHLRLQKGTSSVDTRTDPRTKKDSEFDLAYGVAMATIHARCHRRWHRAVGALNIFLGGGAVVTVLTGHHIVTVACGLLTAALSAYDLFFKPSDEAAAHERDKRRFLDLQSKQSSMTMEELDSAMSRIRKTDATTFDVLRYPVFNEVCREFGYYASVKSLPWWQKAVRAMV